MTGRLRRAFVLAIVVGLVAQSAVAPAMAAPDDGAFGDECGRTFTELTADVLTGQFDKSEKCEAQELAGDVTLGEQEASARALTDLRKATTTTIRNRVEDSKTVARAKAKATAVEAFNNGSTLAEAKAQVNDSIGSYYATMQLNLWESHNTTVRQLDYNYAAYNSTSVGDFAMLYDEPPVLDGWEPPYPGDNADNADSLTADGSGKIRADTKTTELVNGTTVSTAAIAYIQSGTIYQYGHPANETMGAAYDSRKRMNLFQVKADHSSDPTTTGDVTNAWYVMSYQEYKWIAANDAIETAHSDVKTNANTYVENLYATYDNSSDLDVTEVLDPLTLAQEYNTDYNSTGYYGWLASEIGLSGLEGDVNSSFEITYTPRENHTPTSLGLDGNETTYAFIDGESANMSGTLFTEWSPAKTSGSFVSGETYNTSSTSKSVLFVEQVDSNSSRIVELNGTFTIDSLTDVKSGDAVNETTLDQENYQTFNASSTKAEMEDLKQYRENILESYETTSSGGGGTTVSTGGWFDDIASWFETALSGVGIGLLALAAIGVFLLNSLLSG
jgi:hypothetical protein